MVPKDVLVFFWLTEDVFLRLVCPCDDEMTWSVGTTLDIDSCIRLLYKSVVDLLFTCANVMMM